jgi:uncharacterized membrane protein YhiD involved in acid resistance
MITWQETILRLVTAVALGGLVGIERQKLPCVQEARAKF